MYKEIIGLDVSFPSSLSPWTLSAKARLSCLFPAATYLYATMTFLNASEISLRVGICGPRASAFVEKPAAIRASINLSKMLGTASSVARIVKRTI